MITGAPASAMAVGGAVYDGPPKGVYHVIVNESAIGKPSAKTGRIPLELHLFVKDDPKHPEKEGKKLEKYRQWLPMNSDDVDLKGTMNGMLKRQVYEAFGTDWLKAETDALDPRIFTGKTCYVLVDDCKQADGSFRTGVTHMAGTLEKLPKAKPPTENGAESTEATKPTRAKRIR